MDEADYEDEVSSPSGSDLSNTIHQTIEGSDDSSSTSSSDESNDTGRSVSSPGKRSASSPHSPSKPAKRQKTGKKEPKSHRGLDAYRNLLNEYIAEVNDPYPDIDIDDHPRTTWSTKHPEEYRNITNIGLSAWTATDRDRFFEALSRHGRHNLPVLSAAVGTKSIPQVQQYLKALRRHSDNFEIRGRRDRLFEGLSAMPAAVQLGRTCERALDEVAQRLRAKEAKFERREQEDVWGEWGIMNRKVALRAEEAVGVVDTRHAERLAMKIDAQASNNEAAQEVKEDAEMRDLEDETPAPSNLAFLKPAPLSAAPLERLKPALHLLNTPELLDLSMTVFMNQHPGRAVPTQERFTNAENNWHTMFNVIPAEPPSITAMCLLDLLNLVIIMTKRLVSTAHHVALSRLRATDTKKHHRRHTGRNGAIAVKRGDVTAACTILGLKTRREAQEWWRKAARRNCLRIVDTQQSRRTRAGILRPTGDGKRMKYSDVERVLSLDHKSEEDGEDAKDQEKDQEREDELQDMTESEEYYSFSSSSPQADLQDDMDDVNLSDAPSATWTTSSDSRSPSPMWQDTLDHTYLTITSSPGTNTHSGSAILESLPLSPDTAAHRLETSYLTHQDALATREEEARIFEMLRLPPPATHDIKLEAQLDANSKAPVPVRKRPEDLRRWDDGLLDIEGDYASEWEAFCGRVPEQAFEDTLQEWRKSRARKRRREAEQLGSRRKRRRREVANVTSEANRAEALQREDVQASTPGIGGQHQEDDSAHMDDESGASSTSDEGQDSGTDEDSEGSADSDEGDDMSSGSEGGAGNVSDAGDRTQGRTPKIPAETVTMMDTDPTAEATTENPGRNHPRRQRNTTRTYSIVPASAEDVMLPSYLAQRLGRFGEEVESEDEWLGD